MLFRSLFLGAGEIFMRCPNLIIAHAVTTMNALHYCYETTANDETRRLLLLQGAAFLPLYRRIAKPADLRIDQLEPLALEKPGAQAVEEIFAEVGRDRMAAARKMLAYLKETAAAKPLIDAARVLVFLKANGDPHDYKFTSAVFEDYDHISPPWRDRFLATSPFYMHGSQTPDNPNVARTRAALKG